MGQSPSASPSDASANDPTQSHTTTTSSSHITHGTAPSRAIPVAPVKRAQVGITPRASPPTNVDGIGAALEGRELGSTPITLAGIPIGSIGGNGVGITTVGSGGSGASSNNTNNNANDTFAGSPQPMSLSARVATLLEGHHEGSDTKLGALPSGGSNGDGTVQQRAESPPLLHHQSAVVETVPTTFKWSLGGTAVFLTGSFNNWQGKIPMTRSDDNPKEFQLVIDIPPGIHHYKYVVDEAWRLDPDAHTVVASGVVNNLIEVKRSVFEDTRAQDASAGLSDSDDEVDENKNKISYGWRVPSADDYVKDPLRLPPHLGQVLLNSPASPVDPHTLPTPSHVVLNHLYVLGSGPAPSLLPDDNKKASVTTTATTPPSVSSQVGDGNVLVTGITQKFKLKAFASLTPKFVTTVYYSPKPS